VRATAVAASAALLLLAGLARGGEGDSAASSHGAAPIHFSDVTAASGVVHTNHGGSGRLLILDTMGSGLACADFDGDGDDDLYLLTGSQLDPYADGESAPTNRLLRNDGGLHFTDVSAESGAAIRGWSMGAVAGDYDSDGDLDLYVTRYGPNVLLRNDTPRDEKSGKATGPIRFTDVTATAKVGDPRWGTGATFFDYDRDGDLDLYVTNYVDFEGRLAKYGGNLDHPEFKNFKQLPHFFDGQANVLYRNEGDGTFTDVTAKARVADPKGKGLGVVALDVEDDGDLDLYVANDTTQNTLFVNRGDGTFDDMSAESGTALSANGRVQGSMGVAAGDVDGDGRVDLLVTTFDNEAKAIYHNDGDGLFSEQSRERHLDRDALHCVGWASELQDYDCDGDLDVFFANGHVITDVPLFLLRHVLPKERLPGVVEPEHFASSYEQRALLFANDGKGVFGNVSKSAGDFFDTPVVGRGAISADLDRDGDLDLVVTRSNEPTVVLRNDLFESAKASGGGSAPAWLEVELRDDAAGAKNRFGVGARVEVRAGGRKLVRLVCCGDSYLSQHPLAQHFGLGDFAGPVDVAIRWPDAPVGQEQVVKGVATRQRVVIRRER
jgi:hypothetical protein